LNCFHLTDAQRRLIRQRVLKRNRTVLWCYAPGLFNGHQTSVAAMQELTGVRLMLAQKPDRVRARIQMNEAGKQLWRQTDTASQSIGHEHVWARLVSVQDDSAVALGTLEGGSDVILATKDMRGWTSIYSLNPVLPAACLRALARRAGVHLYNDQDDTLYASRSFLTLSAHLAGRRFIKLTWPTNVFDPFSGKRLWHDVSEFEREFDAKETVIWRLA
jgi:hypothetical protein